jgi:hypothetical protein
MRPIYAKAILLLVTALEELDEWLQGLVHEPIALLPNEKLRIVATAEQIARNCGSPFLLTSEIGVILHEGFNSRTTSKLHAY